MRVQVPVPVPVPVGVPVPVPVEQSYAQATPSKLSTKTAIFNDPKQPDIVYCLRWAPSHCDLKKG